MADQGGIQMLLELTAKLDAATKMVRELQKVEAEALKADEALRKAEQKTTRLDRAMRHARTGFRIAGGALKDFGTHLAAIGAGRLLETGLRGAVGLGKSLVMAAAGAERTERAYAVMFGADKAKPLLGAMDQLAGKTELADDALKAAGQELGAAGFKPAEIVKATAAALDVAARTGKGDQAFQGVITALKQMQMLGKAPRGLHELGLGKGAGKAIAKEMASGTTAVEAFARVLEKSTGKAVGTFALERGLDLDVTLAKIRDLPDQYGQKLSKTAGFEKLKQAARGFLEAFDPDSERGKRIVTGLERMFGRIGEIIAKLDVDKLATTLLKLFQALPPAVEAMAKLADRLSTPVPTKEDKDLPGVGKYITPERWQVPTADRMASYFEAAEEHEASWWGRKQKGLRQWWDTKFPPSADELAERARVERNFQEQRASVYQKVAVGAGATKGMVEEGFKAGHAGGAAMEEGAKDALGVRSPSKVFEDIGVMSARGYEQGLAREIPASSDFLLPPTPSGVSSMAAAVGGRNFEAHVEINIGASGGDAREVGEQAERGVMRGLEEIFSRWQAEGGL